MSDKCACGCDAPFAYGDNVIQFGFGSAGQSQGYQHMWMLGTLFYKLSCIEKMTIEELLKLRCKLDLEKLRKDL